MVCGDLAGHVMLSVSLLLKLARQSEKGTKNKRKGKHASFTVSMIGTEIQSQLTTDTGSSRTVRDQPHFPVYKMHPAPVKKVV